MSVIKGEGQCSHKLQTVESGQTPQKPHDAHIFTNMHKHKQMLGLLLLRFFKIKGQSETMTTEIERTFVGTLLQVTSVTHYYSIFW